jgi:mannose-6-phosphate isomerase-like protein (cupin superfamily)
MPSQRERDEWGEDGFFFTEAARGGPLTWRLGEPRIDGDALGPVRHVHDDAAEYFFMFAGAARFEVGGQEIVLREGELLYVPPDAPHNVLEPVGDTDAKMFCVIAPNFPANKWRIDGFKEGSDQLRGEVVVPFEDGDVHRGGTVAGRPLSLERDAPALRVVPDGHECVYLVVDGELAIRLDGGLAGTIVPGRYVHVRDSVAHELSTPSRCQVLRIDCEFAMWSGVVVGDAS